MNNAAQTIGTYTIFGTPTRISLETHTLDKTLAKELSCYPESKEEPACDICIWQELPPEASGATNPKIHRSWANGFEMEGRMSKMRWRWETDTTRIDLSIKEFGALTRPLYRAAHRQNTTRTEMAGQILHEGVLVPRLLLSQEHALLHASAIAHPESKKMICVGGTGGSGKTSLMLQACLQHGWHFAADDISVLSKNGELHPNYSYPKIYGYNIEAFPQLKPKLLEQASFVDKLLWKIHRARGSDKVRRRIDPRQLFSTLPDGQRSQLSDYVILNRGGASTVEINPIATEKAATASAHVLASEYNEFLNHLHWQCFNHQLAEHQSAAQELKFSIEHWTQRIMTALHATRCWQLNVPSGICHKNFLDQAWPLIERLGTST